jgi:hypothetical protein
VAGRAVDATLGRRRLARIANTDGTGDLARVARRPRPAEPASQRAGNGAQSGVAWHRPGAQPAPSDCQRTGDLTRLARRRPATDPAAPVERRAGASAGLAWRPHPAAARRGGDTPWARWRRDELDARSGAGARARPRGCASQRLARNRSLDATAGRCRASARRSRDGRTVAGRHRACAATELERLPGAAGSARARVPSVGASARNGVSSGAGAAATW